MIGNEEFVLGFQLVGIRKTFVDTNDNIEEELEAAMRDDNIGIIILHNDTLADLNPDLKWRAMESLSPVVVAIGDTDDHGLRDKVKRAIGSLFNFSLPVSDRDHCAQQIRPAPR